MTRMGKEISRMATGRPNGRPAKPMEQQRALGNPGHRKLPDAPLPGEGLESVSSIPVTPADLTDEGQALWAHTWEAGRQWLSPEADYQVVWLLCQAHQEIVTMLGEFADGSATRTYISSNGSIVSHPYIAQIKDLRVQMTSWLAALGFSPADRARLGLAEVRVRDELDDLTRRRHERSATG
jgi:P27 family predicted phage terminase small subunit